MNRLWRDYRLLSAIVLWAIVTTGWELTQVRVPSGEADLAKRDRVLAEVYPDTPRLQVAVGARDLVAGDLDEALVQLRAAYESGYKESELLYSTYIDALVRTQSSRVTIEQVVARWQRDYPSSDKLARMRERLRNAGVLP